MRHSLRYFQAAVLLLTITAFMSAAVAGPYDPPPTYYSTAAGTGALLKQQLGVWWTFLMNWQLSKD